MENSALISHYHKLCELSHSEQRDYLDKHVSNESLRAELSRLLLAPVPEVTAMFEAGLVELSNNFSSESLVDKQIGVYDVVKRIGAGGMSSVYLGKRNDGQFEQQVALKVFPSSLFSNQQQLNLEAQALSALSHSNIAHVYDAGRIEDEHLYLVMQYIEGLTLDEYLANQALSLNKKIELLIPVLQAIHHAHSRQILHADIKPQNIMVDEQGTPFLLDFGIARVLDRNTDERVNAYVKALSIDYASPEQLAGESLTTASDIYAAGRLLKWLIQDEERKDVSLEAIINKATEQQPENRYSSMTEMVRDLQSYLALKPISVIQSHSYKSKLFIKRNKWTVSAVLVCLLLGLVTWQNHLEKEVKDVQIATNVKVAKQVLQQVTNTNGNEFERQQQIIDAVTQLDLQSLPDEQAAELLLALAEAKHVLGEYYEMTEYAQQLFNRTKSNSDLLPYHLVAQKILVEMHVHQIEYEETIKGLNYIIDGLKIPDALTNPIYQKLLIWDVWIDDVTLMPFQLRIIEILKSKNGLQNLNRDAHAHLKVLNARKSEYTRDGRNIPKLLDEAWSIANHPTTSSHLKLTIFNKKTVQLIDRFALNEQERNSVENALSILMSHINGEHPLKEFTKLFSSSFLEPESSTDVRFLGEKQKIIRKTPLIEYLQIDSQRRFTEPEKIRDSFKHARKVNTEGFIGLSAEKYDNIFLLFDTLNTHISFNLEKMLPLYENGGSFFKGHFLFSLCDNANIGKQRGNCEDIPAMLYNNDHIHYYWYHMALIEKVESKLILNEPDALDFAKESLEKVLLLERDVFDHNYAQAKIHRLWIQALIQFNHLSEAEAELLKHVDEFGTPVLIAQLHLVLMKAEIRYKEGKINEAVRLLDTDITDYCPRTNLDRVHLQTLRQWREKLNIHPINPCPKALTYADIDPDGEIKQYLQELITSFSKYEPPVVH